MKLHTYPKAPNPQRLQLFLDYKGIKLETVEIDLRKLEQLSEGFRALNPRAIVPVLELDDGSALCDVIAIVTYLEGLYPDQPLLGTDLLQRARILSWDQYIFNDGFLAVADILRNGNPAFKDRPVPGGLLLPQIPELVERGRLRLPPFWQALESQLASTAYLVGDTLTMADIDAYAVASFAGWVKAAPGDEYPALQAWLEKLRQELSAAT